MHIPTDLLNEHFNDRYFDVVDPIAEAQQIHFSNNRILERITAAKEAHTRFVIGETGFGVGRVLLSLMNYLEKSGVQRADIEYNSVELYPVTAARMAAILEQFRPQVGNVVDNVVNAYATLDIGSGGWHSVVLYGSFGKIHCNLWVGDALAMVEALAYPCNVWFLDGHGPKKNPSIWRPELLMAIGSKTEQGGSCSTFTVAGDVRRALAAAGFTIERRAGCGGKKEVLLGTIISSSRTV